MLRSLIAATAGVLLVTGTAFAVDMDDNKDSVVDFEEFKRGADEMDLFAIYDTDKDGVLTREEFYEGTFRAYDTDNDGMWSQTEAGVWDESKIRSGAEVEN